MKNYSLLMVSCLLFVQLHGMELGSGGGLRDIESQEMNRFTAIENRRIKSLLAKITPYQHNTDLKSVYDVLHAYDKLLTSYNQNINSLVSQPASIELPFQAIQNGLRIDEITLDAAERHVDVLIASENIHPGRSIQQLGLVRGSLHYIKNLCMPMKYYQYLTGGIGGLTGLTIWQNVKSSNTNVHIHAASNTHVSIENDSSAARIAKTLGLFMITAGGAVAGKQIFDSWMYKADSREKLGSVIASLRTANQSIMILLNNHNIRHDVHSVNNNVDAVRADIFSAHDHVTTRFDDVDASVNGVRAAIDESQSNLEDKLRGTHEALGAQIEESKEEVQGRLGVVCGALTDQVKGVEAGVHARIKDVTDLVDQRFHNLHEEITTGQENLLAGQKDLTGRIAGMQATQDRNTVLLEETRREVSSVGSDVITAVSVALKLSGRIKDSK